MSEQLRKRRLKEAGRSDILSVEEKKRKPKDGEKKESLHDELFQIPKQYRVCVYYFMRTVPYVPSFFSSFLGR